MIKCKEDLYGTYVLVSDKEAAEIYVGLINKFGISEIKLRECNREREDAIEVHKAQWTSSGWDASFTKANSRDLDEGSKKLTLSDLKPRIRTKYEKVTESIFDLRDEFERGELYCKHEHAREFTQVINTQTLAQSLHGGYCFKKIEKEIDWRKETKSYLRSDNGAFKLYQLEAMLGAIAEYPEQFLEMCRVALRANGELD